MQRYLRLFGVHPHRSKTFKLSTDPLFVEKVRDIVGLYLNPPDHAVVLCVDEKSQIQALERTQPVLPMGFGYVDGITHDYKRHGTTTLFAALDVANGQVLAQCKARHRHQEFLAFLKRIDAAVPAGLDVHLIVDNYATHKHPKVRAWLAERARFHVHYTPTYASWLNQVERWFAILTSREIRRGSFASAKDLVARITAFVAAYNTRSQPFTWTPPPTTSSPSSRDFVTLFLGHYTSIGSQSRTKGPTSSGNLNSKRNCWQSNSLLTGTSAPLKGSTCMPLIARHSSHDRRGPVTASRWQWRFRTCRAAAAGGAG